MENRRRRCRFCLEKCDTNFKSIERNTHEILNMLLITMDLGISDEPVMCTHCSEILQNCFVFKKTCLDVQGRTITFSNNKNNGYAVCEFCMNLSKNYSFTTLDIEEDISEKTTLEKYFPELVASKKLIICEACRGSLVNLFSFITSFSIVEQKIQKCRETEGVNGTNPIKLNEVVQFISENVKKENEISKMEDTVPIKSEKEKIKIQGGMCTLCLEKSEITKAIGENTKNILDIILPQIDITVIQEPVICKNCEEAIIKCFDFKATCLYTHFHIVSFLRNKKDVELDLKDFYLSKNATGTDVPEDQDVCGFCMGLVKNCSAVSLDVKEGDIMLETMIKQCLPELDLSIIRKPVICVSCRGSLEDCFHFGMNCSTTGEKIKKHCDTPDVNRKGQIELSNSLQLTIKDMTKMDVDGNSADEIKVEEQFLEDIKNPDERAIGNGVETVKSEQICFDNSEDAIKDIENKNKNFMEMNDQEVSNEQKFKSEDKLAHGEESNELGSVKIEEIFCEEDETKHKEGNLVEMEGHKFLFNGEIKTDEHDFNSFENGIVLTHSEVIRRIHRREKHAVPNLERDLYINKLTLTEKNVSKIRMYHRELCLFQHKKSLVNHNLSFEGFKNHLLVHEDPSEVTTYNCDSCSFQTSNKYSLKEHLPTHKEVTMHKCDSCSFQTKRKYNLKIHSLLHKDPSEVTMYKCDSCSFQTKRKSCLKMHLLKHKDPSEVTIYKCDSCSFQTKHKKSLKTHLLNHKDLSEVTMYKCDSCSFQSIFKIDLEKHLLKHKNPTEISMHNCDSCSFQTRYKSSFRNHLLLHKNLLEVTVYRCEFCSYETKHKEYLRRHLLVHEDPSKVTMYKCDSCSFETKRKCDLKVHFLTHKVPSEVTMYKCDSCLYQTKHKHVLKKHVNVHKNPLEAIFYKCDSCSFQTTHKGGLKSHLLKHKDPSEVTMYNCDSCSFQTKHKHSLKMHLLKHKDPSEVTMYKCDSCSFQTKHKKSLRTHLLNHKDPSEVTMYKCDSCSFQSKFKINFEKHLLKHKNPTEVTMYNCDSCSFQTKHKQSLKMHLLKHKDPSEVTMYKCDSCLYQTKHEHVLKRHLIVHKNPLEAIFYKCDTCSFQTIRKRGLKSHLLKHKDPSEVTMYNCDSCSFQTKHKQSFKMHLLKHKDPSEVTMYKCNSCSFETNRKSNLGEHLLVHRDPSTITMYKCDSCLYQAKHKRNLKRHLKVHKNPLEATLNKCNNSYRTKHKHYLKLHELTNKSSQK